MFTGIITETGTVATRSPSRISIYARTSFLRQLSRGSSVALEGVCLTVIARTKLAFSADLMPETASRTTLGTLERGAIVNLELPATPTSFLSGHIVQGHADGMATLRSIEKKGKSHVLTFSISHAFSRYIATKGSVALNGISLTVISASATRFSVGIIPHTWKHTSLRTIKVGERVNIEVDVLVKYVEKFI